jgi:hypothetical protein
MLYDWLVDPIAVVGWNDLPEYVFRYIGTSGLMHTVNNRQLRLNAWSQMNDARESKQWQSTGSLVAAGTYTMSEMSTRIDDVLRRGARLLALTTDRAPVTGADPHSLFHRGWGRAPLWAHYGHQHQGVCLVLEPAAINEAIDALPLTHHSVQDMGSDQIRRRTDSHRPDRSLPRPTGPGSGDRVSSRDPLGHLRAAHDQEHRLGLRDRTPHRRRRDRFTEQSSRHTTDGPANGLPQGGDLWGCSSRPGRCGCSSARCSRRRLARWWWSCE